MVNKHFGLGVLVMVLVFGMTVVGCGDLNGTDSALNGTWVDASGSEMKFNNGNFEMPKSAKGTYTTSDGKLTMKITHIHGDQTEGMLDSKWYSKNDLKKDPLVSAFLTDDALDMMFTSQTVSYSIKGKTLTVTIAGQTSTATKK